VGSAGGEGGPGVSAPPAGLLMRCRLGLHSLCCSATCRAPSRWPWLLRPRLLLLLLPPPPSPQLLRPKALRPRLLRPWLMPPLVLPPPPLRPWLLRRRWCGMTCCGDAGPRGHRARPPSLSPVLAPLLWPRPHVMGTVRPSVPLPLLLPLLRFPLLLLPLVWLLQPLPLRLGRPGLPARRGRGS
jgi:hypothetical protein